jgi:pimeloyl-ACP methyl ester carboxylesterase
MGGLTAAMRVRASDGTALHAEVLGDPGDPVVLCMGGWGTFCHGRGREIPRELERRFSIVTFDYRGIGDSGGFRGAPTTAVLASDAAAVLDAHGVNRAHVVGLVGLGGCVAQELALSRPDLVGSMFLTGTWARVDAAFGDQLEMFRRLHLDLGFEAFQVACAALSFDPVFYAANRQRILGPDGAWSALRGRAAAHADLVEACLTHDTLDRLGSIAVPTFVMHAGADIITTPRLTRPIEAAIPDARGALWPEAAHIIAGAEARARLDGLLASFYDAPESRL